MESCSLVSSYSEPSVSHMGHPVGALFVPDEAELGHRQDDTPVFPSLF